MPHRPHRESRKLVEATRHIDNRVFTGDGKSRRCHESMCCPLSITKGSREELHFPTLEL